jgi:hypothetical protein
MRIFILASVLVVSTLLPHPARAQEQESGNPYEEVFQPRAEPLIAPAARLDFSSPAWYSMFTNIPGDWVRTGQHTFRAGSVPTLAGIALLTGALMVVDHQTYDESRALTRQSETIHDASHIIIHLGDGRTSFGIAAAFAIYGLAGDDQRALRTASQTVEATIASGVIVQLFKRITGRESPQMSTARHGEWRPFPSWSVYNRHQPKYYAFPSGHMTTAIATITVIAENYPEATWIRPVGYSLATLMGVSLVNVGWHWYSDFPLAFAMGYAFGMAAAHRLDWGTDDGNDADPVGFRLLPGGTGAGPGLTLAFCF